MGQAKLKQNKEKTWGQKTENDYYGYLKKDLKKVLLLTLTLVVILIVIFFLDRRYQFLGKLVEKLMAALIKGK